MPIVTNQLPNLINGVSQQSPSLRLATQAEAQVNGYSTVADGLKKRPPRILKALIADAYDSTSFIHTVDRSDTERYQLFIDNGDLKVYDLDTGAAKTVAFPNGKGYLAAANPKATFRAKTVADYTFITNTSVEVDMDAGSVEPSRANEAIIYVRAGNYGRRYKIYIDGSLVSSYLTADGTGDSELAELESIDTTNIARALCGGVGPAGTNPESNPLVFYPTSSDSDDVSSANLLASLSPTEYAIARFANVIHIKRIDGGDFVISSEDGYGETAMYAIKGSISTFERLPDNAPDGMVVKINGGGSNDTDHYYVKYDANERVWQECPEPGVLTMFDAATMPHVLVSEADGTFTFKEADWDPRVAGDEEIIPKPSFVGDYIKDITFHRGRLFFLTGENFVASRSEDTFNFWRVSAAELLDDDPIDTSATADKVALLNFGFSWLGALFAFSDGSQFGLTADPILSPKTISTAPVSEFENSPLCRPITVGTYTYFTVDQGKFSGVQEYFLADNVNQLYDAEPITNHVPSYVPGNVYRMVSSSAMDIILALSSDTPNEVFVYKYYWQRNEKLQSSWSRWTFEESSTILWADIINSTLHLTVLYGDGQVAFEEMPLEVSYADAGIDRPVLIDRRVNQASLSPSYNATTEETTFTLPYAVIAGEEVECVTKDGEVLQVENLSGDTFTVAGDYSSTELYAGTKYALRYKLSELFYREPNGSGGTRVLTGGRLQLHHILFAYAKTSYFRVEVTPRGRDTYVYTFEGRRSGESGNNSGEVPVADGAFKVPLYTTSEGLEIEVINDSPFPSNLLSAEWRALFVPRRIN